GSGPSGSARQVIEAFCSPADQTLQAIELLTGAPLAWSCRVAELKFGPTTARPTPRSPGRTKVRPYDSHATVALVQARHFEPHFVDAALRGHVESLAIGVAEGARGGRFGGRDHPEPTAAGVHYPDAAGSRKVDAPVLGQG